MTKYNLAEFKSWLEKQPEYKRGHHNEIISYLAKRNNWKETLETIAIPSELLMEIGLVGWDLIKLWKKK